MYIVIDDGRETCSAPNITISGVFLFECYLLSLIDVILMQISQTLYKSYMEKIPLFEGCSSEFINQIVSYSAKVDILDL